VLSENVVEEMADRLAPQTRIYRSWAVAQRTHRDAPTLELAAEVLGGGMDSRLYQALVNQSQLAVSVDVTMTALDLASIFRIQITLKPGADESAAGRVVDETVARYLREGPTAQELTRAKMRLLSNRVRQTRNPCRKHKLFFTNDRNNPLGNCRWLKDRIQRMARKKLLSPSCETLSAIYNHGVPDRPLQGASCN
jgi:hypothetical protein